MKRIIITILCLQVIISVKAQLFTYKQEVGTIDFGPRIGITTSILSLDTDLYGAPIPRISITGGIFARHQTTERFFIQGEFVYVQKGTRLNGEGTIGGTLASPTRYFLNTLDLPITAIYNVRYKLFGIPSNFDIFGGLNASFLVDSKFENNSLSLNQRDLKKIGADLVLGSGFTFGKLILSATTKIGLTNYSKISGLTIRSLSTEWTAAFKI